MPAIPDALLAIDIETASPHGEPGRGDFRDTDYFELVAVGLGHQPAPDAEVETTVCFRDGDWGPEATADLLRRVQDWCAERPADAVLTHNGANFDELHLRTWADAVAAADHYPEAPADYDALFADHVDLNPLAVARYADRLPDWRDTVSLEDVCEWEGIDLPRTRYRDYDLGGLADHPAIDSDHVGNAHVGRVLGEAYVDGLVRGDPDAATTAELERLLVDYTTADVAPLFELARRFGE